MSTLRLVPATGAPMEAVGDSVLVGRDPACDVVLPDGSVSRRHARLERRGEDWAIIDQGSANGTFLDNQRTAEAILHHGQSLRVGSVVLRVEIENDEVGATVIGGLDAGETVLSQGTNPPEIGAGPSGFDASSAPSRSVSPPPPLVPRKASGGKRPMVWIASGCCGCLTIVILAALLVMVVVRAMTGPAVETVERHMEALRRGDLPTAYGQLSDELRARMNPGDYEAFVTDVPVLRQNTEVRITERSWRSEGVLVTTDVTSASGMQRSVAFRVIKEDGAWKIADIDVAQPMEEP